MAGLFDGLSADPVLAARMAQQQKQAELMQNAAAGMSDPWGRVGATAGALLGSLGARWANKKLGYEDPQMQAAQRQAQVVKALQGADLTTSAGLHAAAKAVRDLGDDVTALKLTARAGETKLAEAKLLRENAAETLKAEQTAFNNLPADAKLATVSADPTVLRRANPSLTDEQLDMIKQKTDGILQFRMMEAQKKATDLKDVKQTDVSETDIKQRKADLRQMGIGPHTFEWGLGGMLGINDAEAFGDFSSVWANKMQAALDRLGRKQVRIDAKLFGDRVIKAGLAEGSIKGTYGDDITDIDEGRLDALIKEQEAALLGEIAPAPRTGAAPATQAAPQTGRRVIPYNPK